MTASTNLTVTQSLNALSVVVVAGEATFDAGATINDGQGDNDFTVRSTGVASMLVVDAANDRVGINIATPATTFQVVGTSTFSNSTNNSVMVVDYSGTGSAILITQDTVPTEPVVSMLSSAAHTTSDTAILKLLQGNGSTDKEVLKISHAGSGVQILGQGDENLSNGGAWTDRSSTFADKTDIKPLVTSTLLDKLKNMKLYRYKKKSEIYGNKLERDNQGKFIEEKDRKYSTVKKRSNVKEYVGLILDDPSTPEELISRDLTGKVSGKSGTQIAEFLLGVCKELINRVKALETM